MSESSVHTRRTATAAPRPPRDKRTGMPLLAADLRPAVQTLAGLAARDRDGGLGSASKAVFDVARGTTGSRKGKATGPRESRGSRKGRVSMPKATQVKPNLPPIYNFTGGMYRDPNQWGPFDMYHDPEAHLRNKCGPGGCGRGGDRGYYKDRDMPTGRREYYGRSDRRRHDRGRDRRRYDRDYDRRSDRRRRDRSYIERSRRPKTLRPPFNKRYSDLYPLTYPPKGVLKAAKKKGSATHKRKTARKTARKPRTVSAEFKSLEKLKKEIMARTERMRKLL